ncbi:unnamed protein product [Ectocarpus sp. 6 AP-2014]
MLAAGAKPKKRSRLALPRQRGARATSNGSALRSNSEGSEQQQQGSGQARAGVPADGSTTAVNGAASGSAGGVAVTPPATASSASGLPSTPTTAGAVGRASAAAATTREEPLSRARAPQQHRVPKSDGGSGCGDALVATDKNSKCTAHQPATSHPKGPEQAGRDTNSQGERGGARRPPLRAVPLNVRSEEGTTAAAAGTAKQDLCTAAAAAAATAAAAASEVARLLDSLTQNKDGCDEEDGELPGEAVRKTPPAAAGPSSSGGTKDDQPSMNNGRASGEQSDLQQQQQQQPRSRKKGRLGDTMPSAASPNQPILRSSQTPTRQRLAATPPGKRGATTTHNGVDGTPSHPAAATAAEHGEHELVEESAKSVGGGGSGSRAAAERRPTPPSPAVGEPCLGKRQRCPVCGSAVWGLSMHINSCLDGIAAGSSAVGGGGASARASTEVAKTPKTEYQEHMQMARALSKSLVAPKATAVEDEASEEELARNPAAFRAKERRLVGVLKDLDVKLERLKKDRDSALRKLAAHRTLGAHLSAGAGGVPSESGGGDGGGPPKTAEEVVDIIFADEHGATAAGGIGGGGGARTPLPVSTSGLSKGGRAQQRGAGLLPPLSSSSSSSPVSLLSKGTAVAAAAAARGSDAASGERPTTAPRRSRRERSEGIPAPLLAAEEDGASDGAAEKGGGGGRGFVAGARGTPPSGDKRRYDEDKGCCGDDGDDDEDDDTGVGRLIRRRSSGGANDNGPRSTPGGDGSRVRRGRTLWAIAQGADELSQSNFVTGVFADIKANSIGSVGGGAGGKPHAAKPGRRAAVTAAAYGDARLYNRRVGSSAAASVSALSSTLCSNQGDIDAATRSADAADTDKGMGGRRPGKSEREQSVSQLNPSDENGDGGGDDAFDDAIQLLSQTLSQASVSGRGGTASAQDGVQENSGKKQEEEAERSAARHMARAPVSSLSGLFPNWKENVSFVFRQGAAELRLALQGIVAALSEEEEKAATAAGGGGGGGGRGYGGAP